MEPCACGCGEAAVYAASHVAVTIRTSITAADYVVLDCGHETPCWIWKGRRARGYANVRVRGMQTSVHRAMYLQEVGPIPAGAVIDHLCDETRCLNPAHLEAKTVGENVRRSVGFHPTPEAVADICSGETVARVLAERYGVSARTIYVVRKRERDRHATHPI